MAIRHWPEAERPRERLLARGAASLSDAELLAVCLRSGVAGTSATELARQLLGQFAGLRALLSADPSALRRHRGLGPAKAAQLAAVLEIARRCLAEELVTGPVLGAPAAVRDYLRLSLGARPHEVFVALFLDAQHRVLRVEELFRGTLSQTSVYPREVVKAALAANAAAVIVAHNHPSGIAQPSRTDELLTRRLKDALALVDVRLLDHFVVAANHALSFAERGLL
ncbi:MAG TPA: DNA repair protein RadC [Burkholderiales bacterium]|nr:DNA repair protein RadC [Burkholderiales bacterium]